MKDRRGRTEGIIIQVVCDCYTSARGDFKNFVLDITVKCDICDGRRRSGSKDRRGIEVERMVSVMEDKVSTSVRSR